MNKIVIFASGSGSNAENLALKLKNSGVEISRIYTNNSEAGVIQRSKKLSIPVCIFNKSDWQLAQEGNWYQQIKIDQPDLIVLAGFLLKIPAFLVNKFPHKIINIHPSLLPKHGGKGMYGMNVHSSVISSKDLVSGITIHYVNENYDEGDIIFQTEISIDQKETPESLAERIHVLEHEYLPEVILKLFK